MLWYLNALEVNSYNGYGIKVIFSVVKIMF